MKIDKEFIDKLKEKDLWYFFLVSLISSDTLIDEQSCIRSMEIVCEIEKHVTNKEDIEFITKAKDIIKADLAKFLIKFNKENLVD